MASAGAYNWDLMTKDPGDVAAKHTEVYYTKNRLTTAGGSRFELFRQKHKVTVRFPLQK